ncbi:BCCT family transporter [Octadecabacter ascidiaceicola]|uniref:Glycine betaine transporter BetL n=1 Tax=Octadecabacter ascidiaceicola TaxID=1655543 RepID=A0A238JU88_9RHOB|nr:BCCT family transporter [Octadecabacter ascidiaceicola]SMX33392.1 Glycine betaine transporter BetL [Octadecabacter ascidiaceicola]
MALKEPFTDLEIPKQGGGFYEGYSLPIALISKGLMVALVLWALIWPVSAGSTLDGWNWSLLGVFNSFYIIAVGAFAFFLIILAILPIGKKKLGRADEAPEFSNFSWFSMMFGAGLGVGLMVFATAEPLGLWGSNPEVVSGAVVGNSPEAVQSGYRYTFLHYGLHAWAIYVVTGLSLAYYAYTRDMPLTIRSALTPILGKAANGPVGHVVDVLGVVATILGVSVTIGFGVSQFVDGVYAVTGMEWLMAATEGDAPPAPSTVGLLTGLALIMFLSILSAVSGVGRGIKYLSNLNLVLSVILLLTFVIFGSFMFAMTTYGTALVDYIIHFFSLSFGAYGPQSAGAFAAALPADAAPFADSLGAAQGAWGSYDGFVAGLEGDAAALPPETLAAVYEAGNQGRQFGWQSGWTTFYWAWWIAFSPFVGLFLARISRGRTVREFILGCVIAPSLVCFAWMTILGGTAIDLELAGQAEGAIIGASNTNKLFVTLSYMIEGGFLQLITVMCVVLIMTFLVTSADSGILVMNTIMSGGEQETGIKHRIIWGVILTLVIGSLLVAGGLSTTGNPFDALQDAMIIGALPFTIVMVLMVISLIKAMWNDSRRGKAGVGASAQPAE